MARIRTVKPGHWSDRELPNISLSAHLLWIATWNFSDDKGVFENDPILIKSNVFPRRTDVTLPNIKKWLEELVNANFIIPFKFNDVDFFVCRTFDIHQKIDRPQPSQVPENELSKLIVEHSSNIRRGLVPVLYSIVEDSSGVKPPTLKKNYSHWTDEDFIEELKTFSESVDKDTLNNFFKYWSEKTPRGRLRLQDEKSWETSKRLSKWMANQEKFNK